MTPRKMLLLRAVVRHYVLTGEPVGSKALTDDFDFSVSSATLRSEMNELSLMGYLSQPHTSAGRVPTYAGLRYYVDRLLVPKPIDQREREEIRSLFPENLFGVNDILKAALTAVAEITRCAAVSATPANSAAKIHRMELFPVGKETGMLVLITDSGVVKNRVCRLARGFSAADFERFNNLAQRHICGHELSEITPAFLQTLAAALENPFDFLPVFAFAGELALSASESEIYTLGEQNLYRENALRERMLSDLLKCSREVLSLLSQRQENGKVLLGEETGVEELCPLALVFSGYSAGEQAGKIGVVGPARMDYDAIIPRLEYFAELITKMLNR
ncbi:MAG: heat-inducible transcriptional repressor HrcA [Oscillospiraceae bacterium]|jgi:heat-inducible transcriptional repressor|nr:heat-inducible transcriptional repressor HrcA [Oscillospiraceae bacterium]